VHPLLDQDQSADLYDDNKLPRIYGKRGNQIQGLSILHLCPIVEDSLTFELCLVYLRRTAAVGIGSGSPDRFSSPMAGNRTSQKSRAKQPIQIACPTAKHLSGFT